MSKAMYHAAREAIEALVKKFDEGRHHYMSPTYQEAVARKDFIDKFWMALGWDVDHNEQHNPYTQEVRIEHSQKQKGEAGKKRADYAFFLAPDFKHEVFFVEAKKPSEELANPAHYFQTAKYGYNAGCPLCVLTDFEQFHIIDCRPKPDIKLAINQGYRSYRYHDYLDEEKFSEIYWLFSREAVEAGNLKKAIEAMPKKGRGAQQKALFSGGYKAVDESFLEYIDGLREDLAKAFKKLNPALDGEALTEATQRTVDRLVFIRFLEDKGIEPDTRVREWKGWKDFVRDSRAFDAKYNGVVFKYNAIIDDIAFPGALDHDFLKICENLSNPEKNPYLFNYIPIHILGSIYERFLGKVVVATAKQVRIEEKPEVRKAGGVYYTPKYIVDYIVKNTVGKLVEGKTPKEIAELRFADIACGSGSFLIGVYEYLLDYHRKWYGLELIDHREALKPGKNTAFNQYHGLVEYRDGAWALSLRTKQEILLNNIWGVDIDAQAVEVTQLSLFLKMLEEENLHTMIGVQLTLTSKVLPDLSKNIQCGNSLISERMLADELFDDAEAKKFRPLDFPSAFPKVFTVKRKGFDAIVGNPPYVEFKGLEKEIKDQLEKRFVSTAGKYDLFIPFIEQGLKLLKNEGLLSFILPSMFTKRDYGKLIREYITQHATVNSLVYFGDFQVFNGVTIFPFIFFMRKEVVAKTDLTDIIYFPTQKGLTHEIIADELTIDEEVVAQKYKIKSSTLSAAPWELTNEASSDLKKKLVSMHDTTPLKSITNYVFQGIASGKDEVFYFQKKTIDEYSLECDIIHPILKGRDINAYDISWSGTYCLYPYDTDTNKVIPEKTLRLEYPNIYAYLQSKKKLLAGRPYFDKSNKAWYELWCERNFQKFHQIKIVNAELASNNRFQLDTAEYLGNTKVFSTVLIDEWADKYHYVLGLLNSRLMNFFHKQISVPKAGGFYEYKTQFINLYPIKILESGEDKKIGKDVTTLVTQLLAAKQKEAEAKTDREKDFAASRAVALDRQIDTLVYQLYNLTEDEIALIENT